MNEVDLGKQLQAARKSVGLTQQELCQKANLSYSTLAKIERGAIKTPSVFTIAAIADVIGVGLDELLGRTVPGSVATVAKKTSQNGVKFVFFDINGCLVRFFHRAFTRVAEETGASPDKIETAFWHYNDAVCRGEITMDEFNSALAQSLGVKTVDWGGHYLDEIDPIPEMHELLTWASEHYEVGLMSNIMPGMIKLMLQRHLLPDVPYAAIVDSSEVGAIKPEEKIYEVAEAMAKARPEEILFVDDSRSNLMGAEKMGWNVLWFDDFRPSESVEKIRAALEFK